MKKTMWVSGFCFLVAGLFANGAMAKIPEYDTALLDCTAKWAGEEIDFCGRGIGWDAKWKALSACRAWAGAVSLDPAQCHLDNCQFAFGEDPSTYHAADGLSVSVHCCLERVKKEHERDIAINQRARQRDYQLCFRLPLGEAFDACAYEVEVYYDARVQELEAQYAEAKRNCLSS